MPLPQIRFNFLHCALLVQHSTTIYSMAVSPCCISLVALMPQWATTSWSFLQEFFSCWSYYWGVLFWLSACWHCHPQSTMWMPHSNVDIGFSRNITATEQRHCWNARRFLFCAACCQFVRWLIFYCPWLMHYFVAVVRFGVNVFCYTTINLGWSFSAKTMQPLTNVFLTNCCFTMQCCQLMDLIFQF